MSKAPSMPPGACHTEWFESLRVPKKCYNVGKRNFTIVWPFFQLTILGSRERYIKGAPKIRVVVRDSGTYYSLLNVNFMRRTKAVAFADDLLLITRGETVKQKTS